ncbi:LOW QUALITY PROTEIN: homogentisate 1,2-dioxygenase [Colletotrichum tofieldiae]|nr:LOW QUALITY PROTEIN: homogentisate 1,2-dioxygenase [Colletotrichum tofieldiae]
MTAQTLDSNDFKNAFHWAATQKNGTIPSFATHPNDPYTYQPGFNNSFESEAIAGTIPRGQNSPRSIRYGLYAEQITASAFVALDTRTRKLGYTGPDQLWLTKDLWAAFHMLEVCQLPLLTLLRYGVHLHPINPRVHVSPTQLAWKPFPIPDGQDVDFVQGLKTVAGSGDPTLREGLATHVYVCNKSMTKKAFANSDGDWLIVPQQGALDIQTEFGFLYVQPGEICVIQRGLRFKVKVEGPTRGYILEIWVPIGSFPSWVLWEQTVWPMLVISFTPSRRTKRPWSIIYKLGGKFFNSTQRHCPFDVVAWHGNYVPWKYDLTKFVNVGSISVDHIDPSIFCVVTAKSRDPTAPLADFLIFSPRWDVASHTYRPPYYHRNCASELMGLIYGEYGGRSDEFQPGSISFECGFVPHGVAYEQFAAASKEDPPVMQISLGSIAFMFETSRALTITDYAWNSKEKHEHDPKMWDDLVDNFSNFEIDPELIKHSGKS